MARVVRIFALCALVSSGCGSDAKSSAKPEDPPKEDAGMIADAGEKPAPDAATSVPGIPEKTPEMLSQWNLFKDLPTLKPIDRVVPYDMQSPLFTDYAEKRRFIYLPEGTQITYKEVGAWEFPLGAILIKQFSYYLDEAAPEKGIRHLETRLLIRREEGWIPEVYVWNAEQTDAKRDVTGELIPMTRKAADGTETTFNYGVPERSECRKCHGTTPPIEGAMATRTLGPMTGQLNIEHDYGKGPENQIDHLAALGWLDTPPKPAAERVTFPKVTDTSVPVGERARAYLHANCAHCHSPQGEVFDKQLWFNWESTGDGSDPFTWGVCKKPTSAGNAECDSEIDIVPGNPDASLLVCRMESLGKGKMAPLGRNLVHAEGVALIREWIAGLTLPSCDTP